MSPKTYNLTTFFDITSNNLQRYKMETILSSESVNYPTFTIVLEPSIFPRNAAIRIDTSKSNFDVFSKCMLSVQDSENKIVFFFEGNHKYLANRDHQTWSLSNSVTSNEEIPNSLESSYFILSCILFASHRTCSTHNENLTNHHPVSQTKQKNFPNIPTELSLKEKLKCLLEDSRLCDFTFQVEGKDFLIHKAVLGAVSPVFCAMFEREMKEKESSLAIIKDIDANTMQKLINFAYTESIEGLQWDSAFKLYKASNKYLITELKDCCANWIISNLTIDNVAEVLIVTDIYQDNTLEKAAVDFVSANGREVFRTESWKTYLASTGNAKTVQIMQEICLKLTLSSNA